WRTTFGATVISARVRITSRNKMASIAYPACFLRRSLIDLFSILPRPWGCRCFRQRYGLRVIVEHIGDFYRIDPNVTNPIPPVNDFSFAGDKDISILR